MTPDLILPPIDLAHQIPAKELSTLLKVSSALASSLDISVVLQTAIESTCEILGLETGAIYDLYDDKLYLGATTPPLTEDMQWLKLKPEVLQDHEHICQSFKLREPVYIRDANMEQLTGAEIAIREARHLRTILYIPLMLDEKGIGVLIVSTTENIRVFTREEIDLCKVLSYQVTLALTNARLFKSIQQSNIELVQAYDATLLGWSLALDMRDQETHGHTLRVTDTVLNLAQKLDYPEDHMVHLRRGSLLHDIGKMSIPDAILLKPGPLTEEEWRIMRLHPEYAYSFLKQIEYLAPALEIPYCHHERWNGSGYPRRLAGEEIPLSARIFAVVDVFDALTSDRPYRKAWSQDDAVEYLVSQADTLFDTKVVHEFLEMVLKGYH